MWRSSTLAIISVATAKHATLSKSRRVQSGLEGPQLQEFPLLITPAGARTNPIAKHDSTSTFFLSRPALLIVAANRRSIGFQRYYSDAIDVLELNF